jgi:hypothetical protein
LLYQWTKNGAVLPGKTSTGLAFPSTLAADSGTYAIVVTNNYGSVTSSVVLTVVGSAPLILAQPQPASRFTGASATFSVTAGGTAPLTYQWKLDGSPVPGATTSALTRTASPAVAGNYTCTITNSYGSTNTANAAFTVLPAPTGYPAVALADSPIAYLRLGETSGTVAHDYWGGHDGIYNNATLGLSGYSGFDSDKAAGFTGANSYVGSISGIDFGSATPTFSLEAWVKGPSGQVSGTGANATIIGKGRGMNGAGTVPGWQFVLDVAGGFYRFYVENATSGVTGTATAAVGPDNTWQHVVAVYDGPGGSMQIYVNGVSSGSGTPPAGGPLASLSPVSIGAGAGGVAPAYDMYFNGSIDEVVIYNTALAADRILAHFESQYETPTAPFFTKLPQPAVNYVTLPATLSAGVDGSRPMSYQWKKGGADVPGATDLTLTISALALSDTGNYSLMASNAVGVTNSAPVALTVLAAPTADVATPGLVIHLKFENSLTDATGRGNNGTGIRVTATSTNTATPTFVAGKLGRALHYSTDAVNTNNSYVTLGVRPDLQFSSNVNFSVAFWVKPPQWYAGGDLPFLCNAVGSANSPGYTFAPSFGTTVAGGWGWCLYGVGGVNVNVYGAVGSINDGNWHHLVHTFDRTGSGKTYLDGILVDSRLITTVGDLDTGHPTSIGQDATGTYPQPVQAYESGEFDIDDLGVWRRPLTPLEAAEIFVGGNVNGVSYVLGGDVTITIKQVGAGLELTWGPVGTLQSADEVTGPYTNVDGATSPWPVSPTLAKKFYRIKL